MCGNTFRLRNPTDSTLVATYDVYGTSERATLTLRARTSGLPYSETFIVTQNKGTVRVFSNSVLVQTKANGGFPCTGNRRLRIVQYQGVTGGPLTPSATHPAGASVSYGFSTLPGYHNLSVVLDGRLVPASGTIKMDNDHVLLVGADLRAQLEPGDEALMASAKAIITSPDPVTAYQSHLDRVGALFDQVGKVEASRRLAAVNFLAFDPLTDAAAIRRTSLALANHEFLVRRGSGAAALRGSRAPSLSSIESGELEPTTIRYVNGILTNQVTSNRGST